MAKNASQSQQHRYFQSEDPEACFKHFSELVAELPAEQLDTLNTDAEIARANAIRGLDAIKPHLEQVKKALPLVNQHDFLELPSACLALGFAASKVFIPATKREIRARQSSLRPIRALALRYLEVASELGLLPAEAVQSARVGTSPIEEAMSAIAIGALFEEHRDALAGKHPFLAEQLRTLEEDGHWLVTQLTHIESPTVEEGQTKSTEAISRDRLWTEVLRRHDLLYQAGMTIWGRRGVDANIPSLQSRAGLPGTAKESADLTPGDLPPVRQKGPAKTKPSPVDENASAESEDPIETPLPPPVQPSDTAE